MADLFGLVDELKEALGLGKTIIASGTSNLDGPVGVMIGGHDLPSGSENFRWVALEPGAFLTENGDLQPPPAPNALAYVPLSAMNQHNRAQKPTYDIIDEIGGYTDVPHPTSTDTSNLIDYTNEGSRAAVTAYADRLLDMGYAGIFLDDHGVMSEAGGAGSFTVEQIAAEREFAQDLITHIKERGGAIILNGIYDIDILPHLGANGGELLTESQFMYDGVPIDGTSLAAPGDWTMARLQAFSGAGGEHIHFVERLPMQGKSIAQTRQELAPFIESLKEKMPDTSPTIYVADDINYSDLTPQPETDARVRASGRGASGRW